MGYIDDVINKDKVRIVGNESFAPTFSFVKYEAVSQNGVRTSKGEKHDRTKVWAYFKNGSPQVDQYESVAEDFDAAIEGIARQLFPQAADKGVHIEHQYTVKRKGGKDPQSVCRVADAHGRTAQASVIYKDAGAVSMIAAVVAYDMMTRQYRTDATEQV